MSKGYIYIYKCIVGKNSNICKIGETKNLNEEGVKNASDRMKQHVRTPYYGFVPYCEFTTGEPIYTAFEVKDSKKSDDIIKKFFDDVRLQPIEIYNIEYNEGIEKIYQKLKEEEQLIRLFHKDGKTNYSFLGITEKEGLRKIDFSNMLGKINDKYDKLPERLFDELREKEEFINNCSSHYKTGNFVELLNGKYVLDINFSRNTKKEIMDRLTDIYNGDID